MRGQGARGAVAKPPAQLLRLHRHDLSNIFVLGGTQARRRAVARAFHRASRLRRRPFVALDCARDESILSGALQSWLTAGGAQITLNPVLACRRGTLYLDSVDRLSAATQRLLLILARRVEAGSPDSLTEPGPARLAVGSVADLSDAVERSCFSCALYDCLDKIRVGIGRISRRGAA